MTSRSWMQVAKNADELVGAAERMGEDPSEYLARAENARKQATRLAAKGK